MEDKKPKVIIVGSDHDAGLLAARIAELKSQNVNIEVVSLQGTEKPKLKETFVIKPHPPLPELYTAESFCGNVKSSRNKRREDERKIKKLKK